MSERHVSGLRDIHLRTVEKNPGPRAVICPTCDLKIIDRKEASVWCSYGGWVHLRCTRLKSTAEYHTDFECGHCTWCRNRAGPEPTKTDVEKAGKQKRTPKNGTRRSRVLAAAVAPTTPPERNVTTRRVKVLAAAAAPTQIVGRRKAPAKEVLAAAAAPPETNVPPKKKVRRGKIRRPTEEHMEARRERRKEKRKEKRKIKNEPVQTERERETTIATWNLQGVSIRERNRARLKRAIQWTKGKEWEIVLLSEIRPDREGVIWLGEETEQSALIHSEKAGILLQGSALQQWIDGGQRKSFGKRTVSVEIDVIKLIAVYQSLWDNGALGIDTYRKELEDELARTPKAKTLVIGGDHNAQVGRHSQRAGTSGIFGLTTRTNEAGNDLLDWCETNGLSHVNSFSAHRNRGTWFSKIHRTWYELDGFLMPKDQRHKAAKRVTVVNENSLSDHRPVTLTLRVNRKKWRGRETNRNPNIKWEALRTKDVAESFRIKTQALTEEQPCNENWDKVCTILTQAAKETCGIKKKTIENPWIAGNEEELKKRRENISKLVEKRNKTREERNTQEEQRAKEDLTRARKENKKFLKDLEKQWWTGLMEQCEAALEAGRIGEVYEVLRKLGTRDTKPHTGTTITTEAFRKHFEEVSKDRFEIDPGIVMDAARNT